MGQQYQEARKRFAMFQKPSLLDVIVEAEIIRWT
jgi:hypothetical protein